MLAEEKPIKLKTAINTRAPLDARCAPVQSPHINSKTIGYGLGGTLTNTTNTAQSLSGSGSGAAAVGGNASSVSILPKRQCEETSYTAAMTSTVRSAADVPPRGSEVTATSTVTVGTFNGASTMHVATSPQLKNGLQETFYSDVRQIERRDDDCRTLGKGSQRTTDIMNKRETDPSMRPPPQDFIKVTRRTIADCQPPVSVAQMVQCTHLGKPSTHGIDYQPPAGILPESLDKSFTTQRCVLSDTGSAHDLFIGTAKGRTQVVPGYMGHCPAAQCNIDQIKGDGVEMMRTHAKCSVNLATSSGSNTGKEITAKSAECKASTMAGFYLEQARGATAEEFKLNRREHRVR